MSSVPPSTPQATSQNTLGQKSLKGGMKVHECNFDKLVMRFIQEEREQVVCGQNLNDVRFDSTFEGRGPIELIFTSDGSAALSGFRIIYSGYS